jgi:deazaflavin-dependent oxidoreductase (nitroreductase family)
MRAGTAAMVWLYRVSGGRVMGSARGIPVLLLTVAGRTTGALHTTPVSFFEDEGSLVVTGSGGGSASEPQWFRNLRHADRAVVEVGKQRYDVTVAIVAPEAHDVMWERLLIHAPSFASYQRKVEREIPMATLTRLG